MFLTFYIIVSTRFGVRSFRIAPQKGFILNGKEYPLRGVSRHQDWPGIGNALLPKHHKKDVELICEMGANTVRLAHYQHAQLFYDLCDEKGLIVWAEIPYISRHMPKGTANTRQQMQELIYQNYNHPSIVVWGLSNEITMSGAPDQSLIDNHLMLNDLVHSLDQTRPTVLAAVTMCSPDEKYIHIPDLVSYNHYFGWYGDNVSMYGPWFDAFHNKYPDKPIGISEYGCEALNWHTSDPLILLKQASYMGIRFDQNTWTFQTNTTPADFAADINQYNAMKGALALDPTLSADYQAQQAALLAQQQVEAAALQAQQEAEAAQAAAVRNQGIAVMQALEPQIQWAGAIAPLGSYTTGSVYGPKLTKQELAEVETAVQTFVGSYITPEMTYYQKICAINSFLSTTCTYAPDWSKNRANTAWGALIYHQAQCSGYSRATKALCDAVGIPCYYVHGDNTSHQWNKVLIGGNWYVVDITNSVTCQNQLFLTSDAKLAQIAGDTSINSGTPACTLIYPR